MKQFKKVLAILLVVSLGTVVACGDDDKDGKNNAANNTQVNNTNTNNTPGNNTPGNNTPGNNTPGNNDAGTSKQLKDLSEIELSALCTKLNTQESVLYDTTNEFSKAGCLIDSIFEGEEYGEDYAEAQEICEEEQVECAKVVIEIPAKCVDNTTECTATVAELEKCTADYIAAEKEFLTKFANKTCKDFASDDGMDSFDDILDSYNSPASCKALNTKCPNLYADPEEEDGI